MKFIKKNGFDLPRKLKVDGAIKTDEDKNEFQADSTMTIIFNDKIYGHSTVKDALIKIQGGTCCFCESIVLGIAHGDIEHFRPKAGYKQDKTDKLNKPGYFWLAYDWNNLLFSCQICNQSNKGNLFPLKDVSKRCNMINPFSVENEEPMLIDPSKINPANHITFYMHTPSGSTQEGRMTIEYLGLRREALEEKRRQTLNNLLIAEKLKDFLKGTDKEDESLHIFNDHLRSMLEYGEFSLMIKINFSKYLPSLY